MPAANSMKRTLIAKTNTTIVVVTSVACFVVVFSGVASYSLLSQLQYQNKIIGAEKKALKQLKSNVKSAQSLSTSYSAFTSTPLNIIGGDPHGTGAQDGSNTKIVLDALPSKYDFPALATSIENLVSSQGVTIKSISGTDDSASQSANVSSSTPSAQPMPFQVEVEGNYGSIQNVVSAFERSIRPFQDQTIELSGDQNKLTLTLSAQTFWQPSRDLSINSEVIK